MKEVEIHNGTLTNGQSWRLYEGDAFESLKKIDSESINIIITSPPYFWLRDYGVEGEIGLEDSVKGYIDSLNKVMNECYRVLKKDGTMFLNIGDTYYSGK